METIKQLFPGDDKLIQKIEILKTDTIKKFRRGGNNRSKSIAASSISTNANPSNYPLKVINSQSNTNMRSTSVFFTTELRKPVNESVREQSRQNTEVLITTPIPILVGNTKKDTGLLYKRNNVELSNENKGKSVEVSNDNKGKSYY